MITQRDAKGILILIYNLQGHFMKIKSIMLGFMSALTAITFAYADNTGSDSTRASGLGAPKTDKSSDKTDGNANGGAYGPAEMDLTTPPKAKKD